MLVLRLFALGLLAVLVTVTEAFAQPPAATFAEIPRVLETGRKVVVRNVDGRKATGRVAEITATSLTIEVGDALGTIRRQTYSSDSIRSINRSDSIWNGLLIGLGIGIVSNELFVRHNCGPRGNDDECAAIVTAVGLVTFVPGGAVVGALVDKFTGNRLIYRAPQPSTLSVAPLIGQRGGGVSVSLRF